MATYNFMIIHYMFCVLSKIVKSVLMYPFLGNGAKRRFNLVCSLQLHYFQGVKMSLGNPISTFPAGNWRPGLSCLGASRPVVVDGISAVTRSCQLVTLRFKMSTNSERPLR